MPQASAQTTRKATLTWTDTLNPTGTTYNVYRATGACSGTPSFTKLASAVAVFTYVDSTIVPGQFCYAVTAVDANQESAQSNQVTATVAPFAVTLTITVQ